MKQFSKRTALVCGALFTALLCMGVVFIDNINHYWRVGGASGSYVQFVVSNGFLPFSVNTNTGRIGINSSNQNSVSVQINGISAPTNLTGNGASANTTGRIASNPGAGGDSHVVTTASGGTGGGFVFTGGSGGNAPLATTNSTGGDGGVFSMEGGTGGMNGGATGTGVATNAITGGNGGASQLRAGTGGSPAFSTTNAVGGNGGTLILSGGTPGTPTAGWSRKTGNGGSVTITGPASGNSTRTNSGDGGGVTITAGSSGNVTTSPGDPGIPGKIELTAGSGGTGASNAFGASIYAVGGTGSISGDVVIGRTSTGTARGGLMVGPLLGGAVSITNILGASASLNFGSTAAATVSDLPITVTGVTSNNWAVCLSVPWESASGGGGFVTFNSNDTVYVRFVNNNLVSAVDPTPGTFTVIAFSIR